MQTHQGSIAVAAGGCGAIASLASIDVFSYRLGIYIIYIIIYIIMVSLASIDVVSYRLGIYIIYIYNYIYNNG
jgi:hypothetical protein